MFPVLRCATTPVYTGQMEAGGNYFLDVSGEEAENILLTQGKDGSFLIRPSQSNRNHMSLSVRQKDRVIHIKIQNTGDHYDLYGGEEFATLMELVEYYREEKALREKGGNMIELKQPLSLASYRNERWFHGRMSSSEAEERLRNQSFSSFLVRESHSKPGDFVLSIRCEDKNVTHVMIIKENGKYGIGDGRQFNNLAKLIDHYRKSEITAKHGSEEVKFTLQKSVNLGQIKASDLHLRVAELSKQLPGQDRDRDGFWEEFEQLQHQENFDPVYSKKRDAGKAPENKGKNRYKNILPYDETRVVLRDKDDDVADSDYINANHLNTSSLEMRGVKSRYIATQGCLKQTVADFWRMVWQEKSSLIVMTTNTVELGKNKCYQYWPDEQGTSSTIELTNGQMRIDCTAVENSGEFKTRVLQLTRYGWKMDTLEPIGSRIVYHYHFPSWPDKMAPKDSGPVLNFVTEINRKQNVLRDSSPMIVHCSAGIGRTGTFIVIDIIINQIHAQGLSCLIDIPTTLAKLREMRSGIVQTDSQYKFIYVAVQQFVENYVTYSRPKEAIYENQPVGMSQDKKKEQQRAATAATQPLVLVGGCS